MRVLVDTHVFVSALTTPRRLSLDKRAELESRANIVYLSSISVAEIMMKELPFHHRDPFDRMLIAQSLAQKIKLMSDDSRFGSYDCDLI